ncbi:MAG: hypothetical protein HPY66_1713 [Firmicutes bacterium]|nr:hypothetical protein [Bacillota bacterium]
MENQGKIKVTIITEDGEEFVKGEYEGVVFLGIDERNDNGFRNQEALHNVKSHELAQMINNILERYPQVKAYSLEDMLTRGGESQHD